ncbi:zinc finger protein 845 [Parasteatoda tepidariorum]|uniref:zinc finger protein 845 n=1 Tax=Parasteatoda tepidariorum TaxID=114398 RepID=UPI001C71BD6F|nr:oocyte zinc finger protein XlCOF6 [Parasteatoda tepidariorum]
MISNNINIDYTTCREDSETNNSIIDITHEKSRLCSICHKSFTQLSCLKEHYLAHDTEVSCSSNICDESFKEKTSLRLAQAHSIFKPAAYEKDSENNNCSATRDIETSPKKSLLCSICNRSFSQLACLDEHYLTHTTKVSEPSNVCHESLKTTTSITHESGHSVYKSTTNSAINDCSTTHDIDPIPEKSFCCSICNQSFPQLSYLEEHYLTHSTEVSYSSNISNEVTLEKTSLSPELAHSIYKSHSENSENTQEINLTYDKPFCCSICNESFSQLSYLREHYLVHSTELSNSSDVYNENYKEKNSLTHELAQSPYKPYSCNICNRSFADVKSLTTHIRKCHSSSLEHKKTFACNVCKTNFLCKVSLNRHMLVHTEVQERSHSCVVCGKSFTFKSSLAKHQLVHSNEKPFSCSLCDKTFARKSEIGQHHLTHHSTERPHSCSLCNKTFKRKSYLTSHYRTHTNEKPFSCTMCCKTFGQKSHLRVHLLSHDINRKKPHTCITCGLSFAVKTQLKNHNLKHTGERPHRCSLCGKCFRLKGDLNRHSLTHSDEKHHECEVCQKRFALKAQLLNHSLIHYDEKLYACNLCGKSFKRADYLYSHKKYTHKLGKEELKL